METLTLKEFHELLKAQQVPRELIKLICPRCKTVQCAQDFIDAQVGKDFESVEKYVGFSCIGRFTSEKGCNWTLGGLFRIHKLEVVTPDGQRHPRFMPANFPMDEAEKMIG